MIMSFKELGDNWGGEQFFFLIKKNFYLGIIDIILASGIQHNDLIFVYIMKRSAQ